MAISELDQQNIWHPFTQSYGAPLPKAIVKAKGVYLEDENGNQILDAVSSWWTNNLGHSNPVIAQAISNQAHSLEHVIFAGFTHPKAVELSTRLLKILPDNQSKVFFSDDGSTSVEVALKMSLQYFHNKGEKRTKIIAFRNSYHGDTFGAMSVGSRDQFVLPFADKLFDVEFIDAPVSDLEKSLEQIRNIDLTNVASFVFEPLLMGTAGMVMYPPEHLDALIDEVKAQGVLCIADEVLTGIYRTGKSFASKYLRNQPDIFCVSKGVTGGFLPLGLTVCTEEIFKAFESKDVQKTFFHGHSYTGNPICCAAACATLTELEKPENLKMIDDLVKNQTETSSILKGHSKVKDLRQIGTVVAVEIETGSATSYFSNLRDTIYNHFMDRNILLRPLGNVVYVLPPFVITKEELKLIYKEIKDFLDTL